MTDSALENLSQRGAPVRAAGGPGRARQPQGRGLRPGRRRPAGVLGRAGRAADLGHEVGRGASTGRTRRSPSGSSAASSTRRTTASTGTSRPARGDKVAYHFEGEPGDTRTITYAELHREVCQAANALTDLGVKAGDRVAIYMPMIPETVMAMLACARIGAPHTVVFGGFSADALKGRIQDCDARVVITADGGYRKGAAAALKPAVDAALRGVPGRPQRPRRAPHRPGRGLDRGPRRLVARRRRPRRARSTRPRPSTPSTRSTSCTPPARPASRRASCTPPAAT